MIELTDTATRGMRPALGLLQVTQIERRLSDTVGPLIDVSDLEAHSDAQVELTRKSRALAAFIVLKMTACSSTEAANSVVDGTKDNGIDAVGIDLDEKRLVVVQSKWSAQGKGSAGLDEMIKLREGLNDLVQFKWDRFNSKMQAKRKELETVLLNTTAQIDIVFAHTGTSDLAADVSDIITNYLAEMNDTTETGSFRYFNQSRIIQLLIDEQKPDRIDLTVELLDWGQMEGSPKAYYGQVKAKDVAEWHKAHGQALLTQNVRVVLPDSEVNSSLAATLGDHPELFWYFNNGITVLCQKVDKAPAGGADRRVGNFAFIGVSVVNGAQTVGTMAKAVDQGVDVEKARVMVRFISLEEREPTFASQVTRATNTQNRIGGRDFLSLDREQSRIRDEFAIDGLDYVFRNGEEEPLPASGCSVVEASIALACAAENTSLAVLAKRELSGLWEDIGRPPYKTLFNPGTSYLRVWRCVQVLRIVQELLGELSTALDGRPRLVAVHGNRFILHIVFRQIALEKVDDPTLPWDSELSRVPAITADTFGHVSDFVENYFPGYPASLFKNATKCGELARAVLQLLRKTENSAGS
ncbi:AIPR family protein [Actinomycetospora sp. TBRC 11914]|uniref:AIPR family protein n=1 Tax=Actinomycetospora sp. TBRC 11914 TaxID=2729387 RepID=UPI00145C82EE|nr:AIPR family protein [Actinomycetospora sp. TBRC 11914]NMO91812.1 hypothetical protein [Actinomycetospora sp. TBRC 11914]